MSARLEKQAEQQAESAAFNLASLAESLPSSSTASTVIIIPSTPFPLLSLPLELRLRIYEHHLFAPRIRKLPRHIIVRSQATALGNQPETHSIIPSCGFTRTRSQLMTTCSQIHAEVASLLYSTQTFRVFPTPEDDHKPTVDRIPSCYRSLVRTVIVVFGPNWTNPGAKVTAKMRAVLAGLVALTRVKVFVECDPSHPIFDGFRVSKGFYTSYAEGLLEKVLAGIPGGEMTVEFDGGGLVERDGPLMRRLMRVARERGARIEFGPRKGWREMDGVREEDLFESDDGDDDDDDGSSSGEDRWEVDENGYIELDGRR